MRVVKAQQTYMIKFVHMHPREHMPPTGAVQAAVCAAQVGESRGAVYEHLDEGTGEKYYDYQRDGDTHTGACWPYEADEVSFACEDKQLDESWAIF